MATAKKTMVTLQVADLDWKQDFTIDHAERLLNLRNNGGWHLPSDSEYQHDKTNGTIIKRTQTTNTATK